MRSTWRGSSWLPTCIARVSKKAWLNVNEGDVRVCGVRAAVTDRVRVYAAINVGCLLVLFKQGIVSIFSIFELIVLMKYAQR